MSLALSLEDVIALRELCRWGKAYFRLFPWRESNNPYHILLAEVFLHRTQARQAGMVYQQFIQRYPRPVDLLTADFQEARNILFSLGLHWRIDLLMDMVRKSRKSTLVRCHVTGRCCLPCQA